MPELSLKDFAHSFGTTAADIPVECRRMISRGNFRYRVPAARERDSILLAVLKKIATDRQVICSPERRAIWEKGWRENLGDFQDSGHDLAKLTPKFIRPNQAVRFNRQYIVPANPRFELDYFDVFRLWFFKKYLGTCAAIYDFGCGSGFNLAALAKLFPEKRLYGMDFVPSAVRIAEQLRTVYGWKIRGRHFNLLAPDKRFHLEKDSAVFTSGSIEQLAGRFEPFLRYLLAESPRICLHVEPVFELYDQDNLVDYLAASFHRKRGYTRGFLPRLRELEAHKKIRIIKLKRLYFGSLYMEGFTAIVWKPLV